MNRIVLQLFVLWGVWPAFKILITGLSFGSSLNQNNSRFLSVRVVCRRRLGLNSQGVGVLWLAEVPKHRLCSPLFFFFFFSFLGPHPKHMEVPRLGVESELQLLACATATAMQHLSRVCDLHCTLWQHQNLNPLREARDWTWILMVPSWVHNPLSHNRNFQICSPDSRMEAGERLTSTLQLDYFELQGLGCPRELACGGQQKNQPAVEQASYKLRHNPVPHGWNGCAMHSMAHTMDGWLHGSQIPLICNTALYF